MSSGSVVDRAVDAIPADYLRSREDDNGHVMVGGDFAEGTVGPVADDVRHRLLELIRGGGLRAGQKLGSERELAAQFAVSRVSLRQAPASLEAAGVVRRVPGRGGGTFVGQPKIERDLSSVVGVPALLRRQGIVAGTRIVSTSMQAADDQTAAALGIRPGALVVDLVRIRLADGSRSRSSTPGCRRSAFRGCSSCR
ncbi:MAG TPA: GntR family transcriptional regulator, partial [Frankiaceae bacterium]|nr:GntR family transcriptional regulator [Frankiaceae bacterium]